MIKIFYKLSITVFFLIFTLFDGASVVFADYTPPGFTTCLNPQGSVLANWSTGTHGIAGDTHFHTGVDTVYKVSNIAVTQCFCADNAQGVQTNWWKIPEMDQVTIASFTNQGWIFIPAGDLWGLDPASYLAQNSSYTCGATATAIVESATGQSYSNSQTSNTNSGTNSANSSSNTSSGSFANTGDSTFVYSIFAIGFLLLTGGLFLSFSKTQ